MQSILSKCYNFVPKYYGKIFNHRYYISINDLISVEDKAKKISLEEHFKRGDKYPRSKFINGEDCLYFLNCKLKVDILVLGLMTRKRNLQILSSIYGLENKKD